MSRNLQTDKSTDVQRLTPMERELLDHFACHRGLVQASVPIIGIGNKKALRVYVHYLRQKIGKHKIVTVHGQGYVYVGDRVWVIEFPIFDKSRRRVTNIVSDSMSAKVF